MTINGSRNSNVAVLGPFGTYTHEAAYSKFGLNANYIERPTITEVLSSLSETIPFAVVPQENSIFGIVIETYDAIRSPSFGFIRGEVILKVEHCLLVRRGVKLEDIEKVMSHEQALGQCQDFISKNLPNATLVKMPSTASAARALLDSPPNCAAICSRICASLFDGLEVLREGIQRDTDNYTRFFIIAHGEDVPLPQFLTEHQERRALIRLLLPPPTDAGSHISLLNLLKLIDLDVGRIDRRPSTNAIPFQDLYFIELHGERLADPSTWAQQVHQCVKHLKCAGGDVDIIGIW